MRKYLLTLLIIIAYFDCLAQMNTAPKKISVFIDCSGIYCDKDYFKTAINIVDFLFDREAADVHVLITSQRAGGGGKRYQMIFYGQNSYQYYTDTLVFATAATATDDERRKAQVQYLQLGLAPLIAKTQYANSVSISMNTDTTAWASANPTKDNWNYWVFRAQVNGSLNYEKVYTNNNFNGNISANRTTNKLKLDFNAYGGFAKSVYKYEDSSGINKVTVQNTNYGFYHNLVKSVSKHISYGYQVKLNNKTFSNFKSHIYFNPAIEYNLFKYQEVNTRFLVLRYGLDITNNHYYDTTLFNKIRETLYGQIFSAAITFNQKWGTFNSGIFYHNYFRDFRLNHFSAEVNLQARLTGALSVDIYTNGSLIHDQINLIKGDASAQDVLTRRRQLGSSFNLSTSFGISYRFGSKLNNFVNPRFQGYGGF